VADNVELQAKEREERGKNAARRLRASGMTPAVLYNDAGEAGKSTSLSIPTKIVDYTLHHYGDNALYDIALGGNTSTARVVDAHRDPVSGSLVHVDFAPVNMRERIEVTVPLAVVGEAPGVDEGGVLQQITIDVSSLGMHENLTLGDLTLPQGVTLLSEPEEVAVTITAPTEITDEEMEAAGIVEEPTDEEEEAAEGEEATDEDAPEEGEGPAGQNVQA
jgi:large subunit ribosomal protein L25